MSYLILSYLILVVVRVGRLWFVKWMVRVIEDVWVFSGWVGLGDMMNGEGIGDRWVIDEWMWC